MKVQFLFKAGITIFYLLLHSVAFSQFSEFRHDSTIISASLRIKNHGAGNGKVLTSDSFGNASWQTPGVGGLWQANGNFIQNTNPNGFWSPYGSTLPVNADNTSYPPVSPAEGNGTRMAWIPSRSAFQGGTFNMGDGSVRFVSENIGLFSFCFGLNAESRTRGGVAIGEAVIADGTSNTLAFGEQVTVEGERNVGIGFNNDITDGTSNTILIGENLSNAGGQYVNTFGWGLQSAGYGTSFLGTFNTAPTGSLNSWVGTDPLFVIGNGQSAASRSNALVIQKNGVVNMGNTLTASVTYKLRVGGSAFVSNVLRSQTLSSADLQGGSIKKVCADANGNLIECISGSSGTSYYNVSAMSFQAHIPDGQLLYYFRRDVLNGLIYFDNQLKQAAAYAYAPVELPHGAAVHKLNWHYIHIGNSPMKLKLVSVAKTANGPHSVLASGTSTAGSGVSEMTITPQKELIIDNSKFYYYLIFEKEPAANWGSGNMALRGVIFQYD